MNSSKVTYDDILNFQDSYLNKTIKLNLSCVKEEKKEKQFCINENCLNFTTNYCEVCDYCHPLEYDVDFKCNLLNNNVDELFNSNIIVINDLCKYASKRGNINILNYTKNSKIYIDNYMIADIASANNKPIVLNWLKDNSYSIQLGTVIQAIENGSLDVIKWLNKEKKLKNIVIQDYLCKVCCKKGYIQILEWLNKQNIFNYKNIHIYKQIALEFNKENILFCLDSISNK